MRSAFGAVTRISCKRTVPFWRQTLCPPPVSLFCFISRNGPTFPGRGRLLTVIAGSTWPMFALNPELYRNKLFMFLCCEPVPCERTRLIQHETRKRYTNENDDITRDSPSDISGVFFAAVPSGHCWRESGGLVTPSLYFVLRP